MQTKASVKAFMSNEEAAAKSPAKRSSRSCDKRDRNKKKPDEEAIEVRVAGLTNCFFFQCLHLRVGILDEFELEVYHTYYPFCCLLLI
jgi:hypothetical protein